MTLSVFRRALRRPLLALALPVAIVAQPAWAATVVVNAPDNDGVALLSGDEFTNNSTIKNSSGEAVTGPASVKSITNNGVIDGGNVTAIKLTGSGTLDKFLNDGGTIKTGNVGVNSAFDTAGNVGSFVNNGVMQAGNYDTVYIHGNVTSFTNNNTISAKTDDTVRIDGTTGTFVNNMSITNTGGTAAVFNGKVTSFTNNDVMSGDDGGVVFNGTAGTITNNGTISGKLFNGIEVRGANTVGDRVSVVNNGTIKGKGGLIFRSVTLGVDPGPVDVKSTGRIEGTGGTAIQLTKFDDTLTLDTDSTTIGDVLGGDGNDELFLVGSGTDSLNIGKFSGFETLTKNDSGAWTFTGNNSATMSAEVNAGSLAINGAMANTFFTVNSGGTLMGSGTTGMVDVKDGGRIAPAGNSVGTLRTGTITFENNSIYEVDVGAGVADKILVSGDAFVGTNVTVHVTGAGSFCGSSSMDILTTTGGTIQGQSFILDTLLSGVTLAQNSTAATLSFAGTGSGRTFTGFTHTPNQASTAAALDAMGCGNQPYATALNALSDAQVPTAMDALSGEGHAAIAGALIEQSHVLADSVDARIEQAFDALDGSGMASGYADAPMLLGAVDNLTVWGTGYGSFVLRDGNGNASATQSAASGLVFGADGQVSEDWRLGVLGGLGLTGISAGATSGTSLDASIGGYAGANLGVVTIKMGAAYTRHFIDTSRSIVFPGVNDTMTASYQAGTAQAFLQFSHDFDVNGLTLTPYAKFQAVNHSTDGFTETGGAGRLTSAASVANAFFVTLGVGAEDKFALTDTMLVTARGGIGWRHAFADNLVATNSFVGGGPFSVSAAPIAADVAVLSGGLVFDVSDSLNVAITYDGEIGSGLMSHAIKATVAGKF